MAVGHHKLIRAGTRSCTRMQAGPSHRVVPGRARARPGHPPQPQQLGSSGAAARPRVTRQAQAPPRASPSAVPEPEASELGGGFSADQLAFLERKARVAAGEPLEDVMPKCDECDGCGMIVCGVCGGTGKNKEDKFQSDGEDAVVLNSNIYVSNKEGHPCWVCRECAVHAARRGAGTAERLTASSGGLATMACGKCDGTGLSTTMDMISGD